MSKLKDDKHNKAHGSDDRYFSIMKVVYLAKLLGRK